MYGWRARIGIIIPSVNTTFEPECQRLAPEGVSFHFSRMSLGDLTIEGLREMGKHSIEKGKELASAGVDLIVFGCTSGSFSEGTGHDEKIIRELEEATGIPALATSTAVIKALKTLSVRSFALCSPYSEELNAREKEFFEAQGFKVTAMVGLGLVKKTPLFPLASRPVSHVGLQEFYVPYKLARMVNSPEAQAIFISCTNFATLAKIEALEKEIGKPVITANQATFWAALRKMGVKDQWTGSGRLFRDF